jgi:Lhr-like helicase
MDVFQLDDWLIREYEAFSRSFVQIRSEEIRQKVDAGYAQRRFWPAPLLQINPHYKDGGSLKDLVGGTGLHPSTPEIFRDFRAKPSDPDQSVKLYRHQAQAIEIALSDKSYVVTTGTGSGKSLCFFIPIVDAILKAKQENSAPRTRAIVIYPMNALANSQMEELRKFLGQDGQIRFARYTGQESAEEREAIRHNAPDILLTNFMMLEMLMTRQSDLDRDVLANCRGLQFIVLDELHTYRGRQGADVAMLMRRLKARLCDADHHPVCIGTSATMSSHPDEAERNRAVADVASSIFGTVINIDAVITETLKRATDETKSSSQGLPGLEAAVLRALQPDAFTGQSNSELAMDDLAIWVETCIGLKNVEVKPERGEPTSIEQATDLLAGDTGLESARCAEALKKALLAFSMTEIQRGVANGNDDPLFAFRLHQLIAGAGRLYATLDRPGGRSITFDGQKFDPDNPEKRLFATHFCRKCGQEHHPVFMLEDHGEKRFEKREIDDTPVEEDDDPGVTTRHWGFLMPEPEDDDFDFRGAPEDYPELWLETTRSGEVRLKATYRRTQAEAVDVRADGTAGVGGMRSWFMPGRFRFCPACRDYHSDATRDINRLASLSAEGRSSATTILIAALLRWMHGAGSQELPEAQRKLLAFTDNRQDAALQAGNFNDFIFVTLLRAGILAALSASGEEGLTHDKIGQTIQTALGFVGTNIGRRADWMVDPAIKGAGVMDAEKAIREGLSYRFWIDQRRGWRFTNPNLEQLGLVHAEYLYLEEMCNDVEVFAGVSLLARASVGERAEATTALLDYMRKGLAVETDALDHTAIEALARRMRTAVKVPWAITEDRLQGATTLVTNPPRRADIRPRDEPLLLRGSSRSAIGRQVRLMRFGGELPQANEVEAVIQGLLDACKKYGMVTTLPAPVGGEGWRINANVALFKTGPGPGEADRPNDFFADLYQSIADILKAGGEALFGFEGREHTAQVDPFIREAREARFRYGEDDRTFLKDNMAKMKEQAEDDRPLPTLFCSPTMELGVDISAMNVVYLRNMPPTPANYVQRSGRAGRSGQAALILGYCSAQSPHDQYFFRNPAEMVSGVVKSPTIDLANQDLVDSHLQAEWLAATGADLVANIPGNLDMTAEGKPLNVEVREKTASPEARGRGIDAMTPVLEVLEMDFGGSPPPWLSGVEAYATEMADAAHGRFDGAFDRWRALIASAERQRDDAARTLADYSIDQFERRAATARQAQANGQISLLLGGMANMGSDFYVYRYLATEGFLPGYNFPRLPLMAFIPGSANKGQDRYLQRARFLAISEFGPGSLVYHEGRAYRVDRAMLREVGGGADGSLPTFATAICPSCGAGHDGEAPENCHVCGQALAGAHLTRDLYRIDNVATRPVERITANDEERRRQGFDLQTTFRMPAGRGRVEIELIDAQGAPLAKVTFAAAAAIRRINRGLRRRADEMEVGFLIDPRTGRWKGRNAGADDGDPTAVQAQRITPVVEDRKNTLLIRFPAQLRVEAGEDYERLMITLQHALARGIENTFQLEEGEILGEPTPSRGARNAILFYEAAEGGAGALGRLVREVETFRMVAREALRAMHATEASIDAAIASDEGALTDVEDAKCVAGCYHCLLSYYNQPEQADIDRRLPSLLAFLVRLVSADIAATGAEEVGGNPGTLPSGDLPPHDAEPIRVDGVEISMVWRSQRIAALNDSEARPELLSALEDRGLQVFRLPTADPARGTVLDELRRALGGEA